MEKAIITLASEFGNVESFASKTAAVTGMQAKGLTRARARELANLAALGQSAEFNGDDNRVYTIAPVSEAEPAKADISALIPEGSHIDASDRAETIRENMTAKQAAPDEQAVRDAQAEPESIPVKAHRRTPPRLMSALFNRAGIAA